MATEEKSRSRTRNPVIRIHIRSYGSETLVNIIRSKSDVFRKREDGPYTILAILALRYRQAGARIGAHALGTGAKGKF
jgi:hypothetical protein